MFYANFSLNIVLLSLIYGYLKDKVNGDMKESLRSLKVTSSGLIVSQADALSDTDDALLQKAINIQDLDEKESLLRKVLDSNPVGFPKSKLYLAETIALKDPKYACKLVLSSNYYLPNNPNNYIVYAKIALSNSAWVVADSALDAAKWLAEDDEKTILEIDNLILKVNEGVRKSNIDNSGNEIWINKYIDKYSILENLYYQSEFKKLTEYAFGLISRFSFNHQNYETAVKALSLLSDHDQIKKYIELINSKLQDGSFEKCLYLGIADHYLCLYDSSIQYLESAHNFEKKNHTNLYYLALSYLISNKIEKFVQLFEIILHERNNMFAPLNFIYMAIFNIDVGKEAFPNQQIVSRGIAEVINKMIANNQLPLALFLIERFLKLGYCSALPYLMLYLSEMFVNLNQLDMAEKLLEGCSDIENHRIKAWILRLRGKFAEAEKELEIYRQSYTPNTLMGFNCHATNLKMPVGIPNSEKDLLDVIKDAYDQIEELIKKMNIEYGLDGMTCIEAKCQDCCTKTFPYLTYTEYIYLRRWLEKQSKDLIDSIQNNSKNVLNDFKQKYNKEPIFILGEVPDVHDYYPKGFVFDCPNLGDNKCNVYEGRPLMCRGFGYGSMNKTRYRGCDYFMEQLKSATKLTNFRKVINMSSFYKYAVEVDKDLIGELIVAPIPRWFAQGHEETMNILKQQLAENKKDS